MIFHQSIFTILLVLVRGGHTVQVDSSSTKKYGSEESSLVPTSYPPSTERPSLPIPTYSPTQSIEIADLVAPSPPNCAPITSNPPPPSGSTLKPTNEGPPSPEVTFRRGHLKKDIARLGIKVSKGITVKVIAYANRFVKFANGTKSSLPFHSSPDGAAVFPLTEGGYVYVSNSEVPNKGGGVYGVYFDDDGKIVDYKQLLKGTTRNCSGGATPWNTYVSCEEFSRGQCWQVEPDTTSEHHSLPEKTVLGGAGGGNFEAVAVDNRNPSTPIFFLTEDAEFGALRRFTPKPGDIPPGWDTLHSSGGNIDYLLFFADGYFTWTCDEEAARKSQKLYYPNVEGIAFFDDSLYFVSKRTLQVYKLDLDNMTYTSSPTNDGLKGDGEFRHQPDQIVKNGNSTASWLYFTEDGGRTPGVYAINSDTGEKFSIFEAYGEKYFGDETTGLAFSPDGSKMYACFQDCGCNSSSDSDCGCLLELKRDDGLSFDGKTMPLKFHAQETEKI